MEPWPRGAGNDVTDVAPAGEVIGRAEELATVGRFVERAAAGCAALVLDGDAGIGKTTVFEAGVAAATAAGFRILRARPAESEHELTLASLTDIFASVEDAEIGTLPPPQRRAMAVALLRADPHGVATDQRTLSVAVGGLLRGLARPGAPLLLAIDDSQWLDDSCRAILAYAVRRLVDRPCGILLALRRAGEADTGAGADDLLAALPAAATVRLAVGPMPLASLHRLLKERLGRSLPRVALVRIEGASGGNPFYALELARALPTTGAGFAPGQPLPVPTSLAGVVDARIAALPETTRGALLLAAAALEPAIATLQRADPAAMDALAPAVADGVVTLRGGMVRFSHPLLAQAVIGAAGADELRRAHARLARAASGEEARARHAGQAAGEPDEAVAGDLERSAAAARARGAALDAASLYELAARLTPAVSDAATRRARLAAECLFVDVSEVVEADAILQRALAQAGRGPARAEALSLRAIIRYYHGRSAEAVELARQASADAGDEPIGRARVLVRLAFLLAQQDVEEALRPLGEAIRLLAGVDAERLEPDLLANALLLRASLRFGLVRRVDRADVERGERLITPDGRSWERDNADGLVFGLARHTDDLDRAIAMTEELIRSKSGAGGDDPFNLVQLSGLLCLRGNLPEARRIAEAAAEGYDREGTHLMPSWRLRGLALVAAHDGRADEARRLATEGLALALADDNLILATFHHHILGFVALSLGDVARAEEQLAAAAELARRTANRHPGRFKLDGDRVEAALAVGRLDEAAEVVAELERAARVAPTPWVRVVGARSRGLLDAARGNLDAARTALDRAVREQEGLPMPFERGRTLLARGQVHRRRKEKRLADEALRAALAVFEELGIPLWADRTRAELARVGRRPTAPDTLTPTEREVAELAAAGLQTPRIAERVFLSPKTVGNVLARVYQKLGIHSRAELGARMALEEEDPPADRSG